MPLMRGRTIFSIWRLDRMFPARRSLRTWPCSPLCASSGAGAATSGTVASPRARTASVLEEKDRCFITVSMPKRDGLNKS